MTDAVPQKNRLLDKLDRRDLEKISPDLEPVDLPVKKVLHEPNSTIRFVYFVTKGIISMVGEPDAGEIVEFATVGPEGMLGVPILLDATSMPSTAVVQVPGAALRMRVSNFRRALDRSPALRRLLLRYTMALLNQIAQVTVCNRLHEVQERCARWLLLSNDRTETDTFPLTHEFLAQMLGVHRPTVSIAAGMLQKAGLIEYRRGVITILDRRGLEAASCNCYQLIAKEYERLTNSKGQD
jgi:CRP-like cAMP-binding protein